MELKLTDDTAKIYGVMLLAAKALADFQDEYKAKRQTKISTFLNDGKPVNVGQERLYIYQSLLKLAKNYGAKIEYEDELNTKKGDYGQFVHIYFKTISDDMGFYIDIREPVEKAFTWESLTGNFKINPLDVRFAKVEATKKESK